MVHPKLLKWKNIDLTKIQNLAAVDQDIADAERDLEILKQRLPPQATPTIRQHIRGQKRARSFTDPMGAMPRGLVFVRVGKRGGIGT